MNLLPRWSQELLKCCECDGSLSESRKALRCTDCGTEFPVSNRVPLLLRKVEMSDAAEVIAAAAGGLDVSDVATALASATRYRLHDPVLRGEFSQIVERYGGHFVKPEEETRASSERILLLAEYFNGSFAPAERAYRSFRIRNETKQTFETSGDKPFHLSYWLFDEHGKFIEEGPRSRFPIPLVSGRELTVPLLVAAPPAAGRYRIQVMVLQEFVRWYDDQPLFEAELIVEEARSFRDSVALSAHEGFFDFEEDLAYCGKMLSTVAGRLMSNAAVKNRKGKLRILELACGSDPQVLRYYQKNSQVVACDLCFAQAQIGSMTIKNSGNIPSSSFMFVSADVFSAPFRRNSFDMVVISAALHHFSDVVAALRKMADFINSDGRIVLLREPGKVCAEDPVYIAELADGFNEQQFELEEYQAMYRRAGLVVEEHKMDFDCSYKAVLKRAD